MTTVEEAFERIFAKGLDDDRLRHFLNGVHEGCELYLHGDTKMEGEFAGIPVHTNPIIPRGRIFAMNPDAIDGGVS